jgi:hypothetical protein
VTVIACFFDLDTWRNYVSLQGSSRCGITIARQDSRATSSRGNDSNRTARRRSCRRHITQLRPRRARRLRKRAKPVRPAQVTARQASNPLILRPCDGVTAG